MFADRVRELMCSKSYADQLRGSRIIWEWIFYICGGDIFDIRSEIVQAFGDAGCDLRECLKWYLIETFMQSGDDYDSILRENAGFSDMISILIDQGLDPNVRFLESDFQDMPIRHNVFLSHFEDFEDFLIDSFSHSGLDGFTLLHWCVAYATWRWHQHGFHYGQNQGVPRDRSIECVAHKIQQLIDAGVDRSIQDEYRRTAADFDHDNLFPFLREI